MAVLDGRSILITGGTGSLGKVLLRRILTGAHGSPERVVVFSRDEAKQHALRLTLRHQAVATDDVIYQQAAERVTFAIGDVRDAARLLTALRGIDTVFHAAALKQVPTCEYHPAEAALTNVQGAANLVQTIVGHDLPVETVVGVSTDKAVSPVNVMGMTKAIQERILTQANLSRPSTRFLLVRYGNVLASRGSVVPLFCDQVRAGGPVTITDKRMTRFLLSLEEAVDLIMVAMARGRAGEIWIPRLPAARITDLAAALIGERDVEISFTSIRPGEKLHECLVSEEEAWRTSAVGDAHYVIEPLLPELRGDALRGPALSQPYLSSDDLLDAPEVAVLLERHGLSADSVTPDGEELLR